jgi:hypothetical protein
MYLKLDPSIRNWVLFPITLITVAVNLLMKYLHMVFNQNQQNKAGQPSSKRGTNEFDLKSEISERDSELKIKYE